MTMFLKDPPTNARTFGTGRRMPNQDLTDAEVRAVIAYLKWMSAIDTNGFPSGFKPLPQGPLAEAPQSQSGASHALGTSPPLAQPRRASTKSPAPLASAPATGLSVRGAT